MDNKFVIFAILFSSIVLFGLGLYFPILATKSQILGIVLDYKEIRLFDSVTLFYRDHEYFLAAIILLFTIVLPILKFAELMISNFSKITITKKSKYILKLLDKWSMLDVFLVALLLLNFKMDSNIIVMKLKIGTSLIAASVILRMVVSSLLERQRNN